MNNAHKIVLPVLFFLLLAAPAMNDVFGFVHFERAEENRRFHDSLSVNIAKLDAFPKDCEAYVNDNFSFRGPLIGFYKRMKFGLYRVSPNPDQLIVGKNGRYFIAGDEKKIYEGDMNFTAQELEMMEQSWLKRKRYFDSLGIAVYLLPCPTALEIYPEDLPFNIRKRYAFNRFDQIEKQFRKRLPNLVVNPVSVLKAGKKSGNIYFMLDNHWTERGGCLASKLLLEHMKKDRFHDLDLSFFDEYTWIGQYRDFGHFVALIGVPGLKERIEVHGGHVDEALEAPDLDLVFDHEGISPEEQQYRFVHKNPKKKLKLLVIRDSFGQAVFPFLKEGFAESLFIFDAWHYNMNKPIVEQYRPDVVVFLTYDPGLWKYINPADR
jgi:hypothetical protein